MPKWKLLFCLVPILALTLAGRAEAACESQHRVTPANSVCLVASNTKYTWTAYNDCTHTIRIKVDIASGTDVTKDLDADGRASGSLSSHWIWSPYVRGVYCCSDFSSCN